MQVYCNIASYEIYLKDVHAEVFLLLSIADLSASCYTAPAAETPVHKTAYIASLTQFERAMTIIVRET